MFRRKVKDPHGRKWTIGRHWMPRRKRFKKADLDLPDFLGDLGGDDTGIFAMIFLRRPWIVFASSGDQWLEYPVVGYLNSGQRIDELREALSSGAQLPPGHR